MEKTPVDTKEIVKTLLDGLEVKSRDDGTVHTVKVEKRTVAEVCVGKARVRLNVKQRPKSVPKSIKLEGKSKSWPGGGVNVTADNLTAARALLASVVGAAQPTAADAASASRTAASAKADARERVGKIARTRQAATA